MKRIIRIFILLTIIGGLVYVSGGIQNLFHPTTVKAFGDLSVDFHVPVGTPIFSSNNMKSGDILTKLVDVTNGGSISHMVAVKAIRTGGIGSPQIENILSIVITDGVVPVYGSGSPTGPKTVQDFFTDSQSPNGIILGTIAHAGHKTYTFAVTFPYSAGNAYQGKSVTFNLTFGTTDIKNVVINEVFYRVDMPKHNRKNDEWVELYNPTDSDISLKDWTITDNSNNPTSIHPNKIIKSKSFVILAKDDDFLNFLNKKPKTEIIELGHQIGDGLDDAGDHLILKDNKGQEVDRMSWGTDTSGFTPPAINPEVPLGSSTERIAPGFDTDKASDWHTQTPPTPGK